jgi:hypothetical protein
MSSLRRTSALGASEVGSLAAILLPDGTAEVGWRRPDPLQARLLDVWRIEVPVMSWPAAPRRLVRISAQLYYRREHYDRLAEERRLTDARKEKDTLATAEGRAAPSTAPQTPQPRTGSDPKDPGPQKAQKNLPSEVPGLGGVAQPSATGPVTAITNVHASVFGADAVTAPLPAGAINDTDPTALNFTFIDNNGDNTFTLGVGDTALDGLVIVKAPNPNLSPAPLKLIVV